MNKIMNAGLQYLGSPKKSIEESKDSQFVNDDYLEDDAFSEPHPPTDNMSILHSALQQQEAALLPSIQMSEASLYKTFCLEAGIIGDTAGFFIWQEKHSGVKTSTSSVPLVHISDTPANNTGKIHVTRLANVGVLCNTFVSEKLASGFNKSVFVNAALYDIYAAIRHGAGMGLISTDTIWTFISFNGITPNMCNELVLAQYTETVLDHHDPDRPMISLMRVLEVTMGIPTVNRLRLLVQCIKDADDSRGYGAPFRLLCFLHVIHRLVQEALHNPRYTLIVHPFRTLIDAEITSLTLTSDYYSTAKISRRRIKDAKQETEMKVLANRLDKIAHPSSQHNNKKPIPLNSGRTITQETAEIPVKRQEVCLPHMRSPSLCPDPCRDKRLHLWPATMPIHTKDMLLARAALIPLPAAGKPVSGSVSSSKKSLKSGSKSRPDSPSSVESAVSSISATAGPL
jgi:hypothetical protein